MGHSRAHCQVIGVRKKEFSHNSRYWVLDSLQTWPPGNKATAVEELDQGLADLFPGLNINRTHHFYRTQNTALRNNAAPTPPPLSSTLY